MTIKKQILVIVVTLIIFQVLIAGVGIFFMGKIETQLDTVFNRRLPSIDNLVQADRDFQQALVAERTLLVDEIKTEEKEKQIKDYVKNRKQVLERFKSYEELANSDAERKHIADFYKSYKIWADSSDEKLNISIENLNKKFNFENSLNIIAPLFENSRNSLDNLQELILGYSTNEYKDAQESYNLARKSTITLIAVGLIVSMLISFLFIRAITTKINSIIQTINDDKGQLDIIANELLNNSGHLATAANEQASSVTETSSSIHEISQMVKKNTDMAVTSSSKVQFGKSELSKGLELIFQLAQKVEGVNKSSRSLADKIGTNHNKLKDILEVFKDIQEKTGVINDIVFQTKLLSFNASVESARAGEHGKGFSVVAEEVGNLAAMSGKSANEISDLLNSSLSNVSEIITTSNADMTRSVKENEDVIAETLALSTSCEEILNKISDMFSDIASSSEQIADASKEQQTGVEEINIAVQEINSSNQETTNSATLIDKKSSDLVELVKSLDESMGNLKKLT